jgi:hypothetical protein
MLLEMKPREQKLAAWTAASTPSILAEPTAIATKIGVAEAPSLASSWKLSSCFFLGANAK